MLFSRVLAWYLPTSSPAVSPGCPEPRCLSHQLPSAITDWLFSTGNSHRPWATSPTTLRIPGCATWVPPGFWICWCAALCPLCESNCLTGSLYPADFLRLKLGGQESTARGGEGVGARLHLDVSSLGSQTEPLAPWKDPPLGLFNTKRTLLCPQIFVSRQNSSVS